MAESVLQRHRKRRGNELCWWYGAPYGGVLREALLICICRVKAIPRVGEFGVHSKVQANRAERHLRLERVR
jgi:hypothetical protein